MLFDRQDIHGVRDTSQVLLKGLDTNLALNILLRCMNGATNACKFEEVVMDADLYCSTLHDCLLPFVQAVYPHHHHFMQDNSLKHTSC